MYKTVTMIANTTPAFFADWLVKYTQEVFRRPFPTERGQITLQSARATGYNQITMDGSYLCPSLKDPNLGVCEDLGVQIGFDLTQLSTDRTQIRGYCNSDRPPALAAYFDELLADIAKCWSETREALGLGQSTADDVAELSLADLIDLEIAAEKGDQEAKRKVEAEYRRAGFVSPYKIRELGEQISKQTGKTVVNSSPTPQPGSLPQNKQATPSNVLLVTVTKVEAVAVLDAFSQAAGRQWERQTIGDKTYHALGEIGGVKVFMVQSEMGTSGPGAALLTIHKALEALAPVAIIMVGIAFGTRPNEHTLCDILVSKQLQSYEPQKVTGHRTPIPRGDRVTASIRLLDKFHSGDLDWTGANVRFGLILSGEKLVNDLAFRQQLLELEPEAIGGEMEGAGLYAAANDAKVDWILVKAICDWADGNKGDEHQQVAARNAAAFTLHVLQQGGLGNQTL